MDYILIYCYMLEQQAGWVGKLNGVKKRHLNEFGIGIEYYRHEFV